MVNFSVFQGLEIIIFKLPLILTLQSSHRLETGQNLFGPLEMKTMLVKGP